MDLPDALAQRIIDSIQARMPADLEVVRVTSQVVNFRGTGELVASTGRPSVFWGSLLGVRDRDGLTPESVAWATWVVLDSAIRMSRRYGTPWHRDVAAHLHAYAEARDRMAVNGWVSDGSGFRVDFPAISLTDVQLVKGRRGRFPLARRYRLPVDGPVTDPGNR